MEQAKTISGRAHIRVTLNEDKSIKRELMLGAYKICDLPKADAVELLMNLSSSMRYD